MTDLHRAREYVESVDATAGSSVAEMRDQILEAIDRDGGVANRTCRPGHLTGSAFVVDAGGDHFVLLFHRKLQRWLQPGGHADGESDLASVALREATEETGLDGLLVDPEPLDVDIHEVRPPAEDAHLHLDVRFLVTAPPGAVLRANHESEHLEWFAWDDLARSDLDLDEGLLRLAARARARRSV